MTQISFGYSNSDNPNGSFEGMGASPDKDIVGSKFQDFFNYNGNNYLVSMVNDVFPGQEDKIGTFDVRQVLADVYSDGSGTLFSNQTKDNICRMLEQKLLSPEANKLIEQNVSINEILGANNASQSFYNLLYPYGKEAPEISVTGIRSDIFEKKSDLISNCHTSISSMQEQLENSMEKNNVR